jgi:hypothetical protein
VYFIMFFLHYWYVHPNYSILEVTDFLFYRGHILQGNISVFKLCHLHKQVACFTEGLRVKSWNVSPCNSKRRKVQACLESSGHHQPLPIISIGFHNSKPTLCVWICLPSFIEWLYNLPWLVARWGRGRSECLIVKLHLFFISFSHSWAFNLPW